MRENWKKNQERKEWERTWKVKGEEEKEEEEEEEEKKGKRRKRRKRRRWLKKALNSCRTLKEGKCDRIQKRIKKGRTGEELGKK